MRKGLSYFVELLFIAWLFITPLFAHAGQSHHVKLLYFFSASCNHCKEARPTVIELGKEYNIEGFLFNDGNPQSLPFPVKAGDKKTAKEVYGVMGVPTLAVIVDGKYKQKIAGSPDIQDAKVIIKALANGAMTVTEAAEKAPDAEITITGWIIAKGEYFKKAQFFITDRTTELPVKAWLPLEAMKGLFKSKRPRLMSDVIKKPIVLKGSIKKTAKGSIFLVKEGKNLE